MFGLVENDFFRPFYHETRPFLKDFEDFNLEKYNNFKEGKKEFVAHFSIGGKVKSDDIDISVDGNAVTVSYKYAKDDYKFSSVVTETLPEKADMDTIDAVLEDGILTVTVKKKEEKKDDGPVKINIKK